MLNLLANAFKPRPIFFLMDGVVETELNKLVGKTFDKIKLNNLVSNKFGTKLEWSLDNSNLDDEELECGIKCYSASFYYSETMVLDMWVFVGTTNRILYTEFIRQNYA